MRGAILVVIKVDSSLPHVPPFATSPLSLILVFFAFYDPLFIPVYLVRQKFNIVSMRKTVPIILLSAYSLSFSGLPLYTVHRITQHIILSAFSLRLTLYRLDSFASSIGAFIKSGLLRRYCAIPLS